jgi:hypothetical protein
VKLKICKIWRTIVEKEIPDQEVEVWDLRRWEKIGGKRPWYTSAPVGRWKMFKRERKFWERLRLTILRCGRGLWAVRLLVHWGLGRSDGEMDSSTSSVVVLCKRICSEVSEATLFLIVEEMGRRRAGRSVSVGTTPFCLVTSGLYMRAIIDHIHIWIMNKQFSLLSNCISIMWLLITFTLILRLLFVYLHMLI